MVFISGSKYFSFYAFGASLFFFPHDCSSYNVTYLGGVSSTQSSIDLLIFSCILGYVSQAALVVGLSSWRCGVMLFFAGYGIFGVVLLGLRILDIFAAIEY